MDKNKLIIRSVLVVVLGLSAFGVNYLWKIQNIPATKKYAMFKKNVGRGTKSKISETFKDVDLVNLDSYKNLSSNFVGIDNVEATLKSQGIRRNYQKGEMWLANDETLLNNVEFGPFELEAFDQDAIYFKIKLDKNNQPEEKYRKLLLYLFDQNAYEISDVSKATDVEKNELLASQDDKPSGTVSHYYSESSTAGNIYNKLKNFVNADDSVRWVSYKSGKPQTDKSENSNQSADKPKIADGPFFIKIKLAQKKQQEE